MSVKLTFSCNALQNGYKNTVIYISLPVNMLRIYKKKSDILVQLGKASDDTRYLDRAMERGEVIVLNINWVNYYGIYKEVEKYFLGILVWEVETISGALEKSSGSSEELEEAKANVEYYAKENEELSDKNAALESILDNLRAKGIDIWYAAD